MPNQTVLVVEENSAIRELIRAILQYAGYAVVTPNDGVEALTTIERRQSEISLLLTDLVIPNMNGVELADRALELDPQLPVLFMAALSGGAGEPGEAGRESQCIARPFTCSELIKSVHKVLNPATRPPQTASAQAG